MNIAADFGEIGHRVRSKPATFSVKSATPGRGEWSSAEL